jgi:coproporphyrinogen III oxidase-like Fe-S oxidoreductase
MGLRLGEGVNLESIAAKTGLEPSALIDASACATLTSHGLITAHGSQLQVTSAGMPLLDRVLVEIVAV